MSKNRNRPKAMLAGVVKAQLVGIRAPVTVEASAADGSSGPPKFTATPLYSGGLVPGYASNPPQKHPFVIDLAGMTNARKQLANLEHDDKQRVGHVTDVVNDHKTLSASGVMSASTEWQKEIADSSANGFPWEVSLEAPMSKPEMLASGKTATVNGQSIAGPALIFRKSTFSGLAFVSRGADQGNSVSIAASAAKGASMTPFQTYLAKCGIDEDTLSDEAKAILSDTFEKANAKAGAKVSDGGDSSVKALALLATKEAERVEAIKALMTKAWRGKDAYTVELISNMADDAIENGMSATDFELNLFRGTSLKYSDFNGGTRTKPQVDAKTYEAALAMAVGLPEIEKHYKPDTLQAVEDNGMHNMKLGQFLIQAAHANGYRCRPGEGITQSNLRSVLEYAFPARAQMSQFSSISVPGILANVASKELLAGFMDEDQAWREIAAIKSVPDFKQMTSYRMTDGMEYELVPKGGEIAHGTLGEESYTRQAKTYAKMLGLDRVDIINDDLGAFEDLRNRMGRGSAKKLNSVFWTAFLGNTATLFPTSNSLTNYLAGATTTLLVDGVGMELAAIHFAKMTDTTGKRIGGRATVVLTPPEVYWAALKLYTSTNIVSGDTASKPDNNVWGGQYRPVLVTQLSDTSYTGYSTTAWYLFRDKNILAPMNVSFLNGQQTPTVESTDADFNTLGILFRGFHDFGCDIAEPLAGIKVKGAA